MVEKWIPWFESKLLYAKGIQERTGEKIVVLDWGYNEELVQLYASYGIEFVSLKEKMFKNWFFVYIGNFLGAAFVALLVVLGRTPELFSSNLAQSIVNAGAARTNLTFVESFIRGILCNILVCIAIWMSFAAKQVSDKLLTSFWPVFLFVLCGFEHCVADMYFGVAALLTANEYGIVAESLTWVNFFKNCMLPVTLGNIVGGACIVGYGYWLIFLHKTPYSQTSVVSEQKEMEIAEEY